MRLADCHNHHDFRRLAQRRLPGPIFDYIDGAADDETTCRRNTASFEHCDLVPSVLRGAQEVDLSVTVMGQKLAVPFYCSPTALQRLFHHRGEHAVAAAARHGTLFGASSLGTVSLEELRRRHPTPQVYPFYFHKDRGLNRALMQREIFGPILPLLPYRSLDDVIARINAGPRPLAVYPFSNHSADIDRVIERVMSGGVTVNDALMHVGQDDMPFGGVGESGMGHYHGYEGFLTFSKLRPVFRQARWASTKMLMPPYGKLAERVLGFLTR